MKLFVVSLTSFLMFFSLPAISDINFTGYGSIIGGRTLGQIDDPLRPGQKRDEILTADFYDVGQYDNDFTFNAESIFALQTVVKLSDQLQITGQLVAKAVDNFQPEFDWYYLTYKASDSLTFMAGRRNIPMYYYSEYSEVGFAYPWMRPPSNLYWWQVTQFNGLHAMYDFELGKYDNTLTFFYGNEYSNDNVELLYYNKLYGGSAQSINEFWTKIAGLNWNISGDNFDLRFVYFQNNRGRETIQQDGSITDGTPFTQSFMGVGGKVDIQNLTVLFDWNVAQYDDIVETKFPTYLVSLVYNIGDYQPYIVYSKANQEQGKLQITKDLEEHYIMGYGLRYNVLPNASIKLQYDHFEDEGNAAIGWAYHGSSDTVTIGLDFILQ